MSRRAGRDLTVGTVAAIALVTLAIGVMAVGGETELFSKFSRYRVRFSDTSGLRVGSPVKVSGVTVGSVEAIRLPTDPKAEGIEVVLGVRAEYAPRIRAGSEASLRFLQLVSGEKYVEITPGSASGEALPEGALLPVVEQPAILEQGGDIAENLNEITISLKAILEPLQKGQGLLGEMLQDPNFGKEGLEHLHDTLANLDVLSARLRNGEGFLGRVLVDRELADKVDDLSAAITHIASLAEALDRREGALGAMTRPDGAGQQAVDALRDAAESLRRTAAKLEKPEGLVGRLLNDPQYSEKVAGDLERMLDHGASIAKKIDEGEGTIGALVNDRSLYDAAEQTVVGVDDSKLAHWLIRHYRKRGIEVELKENKPAP